MVAHVPNILYKLEFFAMASNFQNLPKQKDIIGMPCFNGGMNVFEACFLKMDLQSNSKQSDGNLCGILMK